ncbi:MAG: helix-turn-helix transcriptional regulator [Sphingopyxis sp.]|uniref:helix-turn-helix transcriptional regulator n=1 Tax=Sphingopyxis sp. TaxID=1908224 RepID=UPI001A5A7188|nr:helix-turn-helix transcriptional regulator [Sphingopyxis sp.]MBL9065549.1 helix-turn-helix transcriptional regulator [Sphingopyxis sp.]
MIISMTPTQSKMARVALKWTTDDLAEHASVGRMTVARFERGDGVAAESVEKMRKALADAGADFTRKAGRVGVTVPE